MRASGRLVVSLILQSFVVFGHEGHEDTTEGMVVDPYHEIMEMFEIAKEENFSLNHLQHMKAHFLERFPCMNGSTTLVSMNTIFLVFTFCSNCSAISSRSNKFGEKTQLFRKNVHIKN